MIDRLPKSQIQESKSLDMINEKPSVFIRHAEPLPLDAVSLLPAKFLEDPQNRSVHVDAQVDSLTDM